MKIVTAANGKQTIKMSKKEWMNIGKKAGWESPEFFEKKAKQTKKSQIIPDDGYADGGEPYTDEEMDLMEREKPKWGQKTVPKKELPFEEIQDYWEGSEDDVKINDKGEAFCSGKLIAKPKPDGNADYYAIWKWMKDSKYYPNVWEINDHGNVSLLSLGWNGSVTYLGGIV